MPAKSATKSRRQTPAPSAGAVSLKSPTPPRSRTKVSAADQVSEVKSIDFNRSRRKSATADQPKTNAKPIPTKYSTAPIESQLERDAFARNFRVLRKEAGLSQRDIQKLTGIAQSHVSEIESAMHNICIETMVKLAKLVNKPIHELLKP